MSVDDGIRAWGFPAGCSLVLHLLLVLPFLIWPSSSPTPVRQQPSTVQPIQAEVVDSVEVQNALEELERREQQKIAREKSRQQVLQETEKKLRQAQQQLETAEQKKRAAEQKAVEAEKKRQEDERKARLAAQKAEQAAQQKLAAEKKAREIEQARKEAEQKRQQALAEEARRREEQQRAEAQKKVREQEARRKQEEEALRQQQLAEEQKRLDAEEIGRFMALIRGQVSSHWRKPPNWPEGRSCEVAVKLIPGGEVVDARVTKSCGDPLFNRSVEGAVLSASPLPVPSGPLFDKQFRNFTFVFKAE